MKFEHPFLIYELKESDIPRGGTKFRAVVRGSRTRAYIRTRCAESQRWRCCYCNCVMSTNRNAKDCATLEHIVPRSKGGEDTYDNCVAACKRCNNLRGTHDLNEDMTLPHVVTAPKILAGFDRRVRRGVQIKRNGGCIDTWFASLRIDEKIKSKVMEHIEMALVAG